MARKSWKLKGSRYFQPGLFFFSLPGGKGGKITTATPTSGESKYKRTHHGRKADNNYPERTTDAAVRARQRERLRRVI